MATGTRREADADPELRHPEVSICEGGPGTVVLIESGNTDGWLASDLTVDVEP